MKEHYSLKSKIRRQQFENNAGMFTARIAVVCTLIVIVAVLVAFGR